MSRFELALEALDLRDWIEQYVKTQNVSRSEFSVQTCPKCLNDKHKLYINTSKLRWYCQRCGFGKGIGDVTILMAEVSGRSLQDVRIELLQMVVPSVAGDEYNAALYERLSDFNAWSEDDDLSDLILPMEVPGLPDFDSHTGKQVLRYAESRGLSRDLVDTFQLRSTAELKRRLGPYLVFPVIYNDMMVSYQGRRINAGDPKYLSADNIGNWLWPCNINYMELLQKSHTTVLVEGVFDALGCLTAGIPAQCTFGKNVTDKQLKLLRDHNINTVYLGWDPDTYRDVVKAVDTMTPGFNVKIMDLVPVRGAEKTDPGDVIQDRSLVPWLKDAYNNAIDAHSSEYWTWRLSKELK